MIWAKKEVFNHLLVSILSLDQKDTISIYFTVALHYLVFLIDHFLNRTGGFTASKIKMSHCHI